MPNAKAGWTVEVKRADAGAADGHGGGAGKRVTEINWTGGVIPVGMRDEFLFSAKAPASESTLQWKAYQQYQDGSVVAWERDPKDPPAKTAEGKSDFSKFGPYSQSRVVDDLKKSAYPAQLPLWISLAALALSLLSLALAWFRRHPPGADQG